MPQEGLAISMMGLAIKEKVRCLRSGPLPIAISWSLNLFGVCPKAFLSSVEVSQMVVSINYDGSLLLSDMGGDKIRITKMLSTPVLYQLSFLQLFF